MVKISHLNNNITIVMEQMEHVRSVSLGLWVRAGSVNESQNNNGCAHLLEHMLFKGTKKRSARQLADDMSAIGGNMNAYTSKECTSFYFTTIDKCLNDGIEIMSDMLFNSVFDPEDYLKERQVVLEEIDMYEDLAEDVVHEYIQTAVWQGHPLAYNISGSKSVVEQIKVDDVVLFKNTFYTPENITISVAGHFDENEILKVLEYYFGERMLKSSNKNNLLKSELINNTVPVSIYHQAEYKRFMDIEQVHINIVFETVSSESEERYIAAMANSILGGNDNSRLFQHIREDMGAAYSVCSYLGLYSITGLLHIDAVVNPVNVSTVVEAIFGEVNRLRNEDVSNEELKLAKAQYEIDTILSADSPKGMMNRNGNQYIFSKRILTQDEILKQIQSVSIQDVRSFFEKYIVPEKASIAYAGNI